MKLFVKTIVYALVVVCLCTASLMIFKEHRDVQLAFLFPGLFLLVYSLITDDLVMKQHVRSRQLHMSEKDNFLN